MAYPESQLHKNCLEKKKEKKKPEHKVYCRLDTLAINVAIKLWGLGNAWG